ncbi:MAG: penicillin acylase family protein, partial [Acidobacteriia bacterium]|nr:penicillin acylase family protein [Terriglobia bacterium]
MKNRPYLLAFAKYGDRQRCPAQGAPRAKTVPWDSEPCHHVLRSYLKKLVLILAAASVSLAFQAERGPDVARWKQEARNVTIIRDDWGIAHVYGKTDADTVFGMMYAQAEDDFNRVETNYINAMGRLAEAEGESRIYQDLRMKLFIDPGAMKTQYAASPAWLKSLMNAFADGLNY